MADDESSGSRCEALAVLVTGALFILVEELFDAFMPFMIVNAIAWPTYLLLRARRDPAMPARWGFRRAGLRHAFLAPSIVFLIGMAAISILAAYRGTIAWHVNLVPLLLLYPVWALIQQLLVQGLLVRWLAGLPRPWGSVWFVAPVAGLMFALSHWPGLEISLASFLLGVCFTCIYIRDRNLWPLGLYHGWLGAFFYLWILEHDMWGELFG